MAEGVAAAGAPQRPGDSDGEGGQLSYHQLLQHRPRPRAHTCTGVPDLVCCDGQDVTTGT